MSDRELENPRRRFLQMAGSGAVASLAGCLGLNGPEDPRTDRAVDWCIEELDAEEVPEEEATATSIDGIERRDEDELDAKEDVVYECGARDGMQCGNCTFYISDQTGDAIGACTEVEGRVRSIDWCAVWQPREKMGES